MRECGLMISRKAKAPWSGRQPIKNTLETGTIISKMGTEHIFGWKIRRSLRY
jgi:hypothetical protein